MHVGAVREPPLHHNLSESHKDFGSAISLWFSNVPANWIGLFILDVDSLYKFRHIHRALDREILAMEFDTFNLI